MHEPLKVKTLNEARSELLKYWQPETDSKEIEASEAHGEVLASDLTSEIDLPPFDRSVYDGYAVRAEDTFGAEEDEPETLRKIGEIMAGDVPKTEIDSGDCVEISTGAPVPEGADAVVMIENVTVSGDGNVQIRRSVSPGENISLKGSEMESGEKIASKDRKVNPQLHGSILACGLRKISVYEKPKVGIVSTGNELVEAGSELEYGQVYNINGPAVSDAVANCGAEPHHLGIVEDDRHELGKLLEKALGKYDMLITSGGSSAGSSDVVPEAIDSLGEPGVIVHGLAQKPGKPTVIAVAEEKPIFGLPGYPVSALMEFDQIVAPFIRDMSGRSRPERTKVEAKIERRFLPAKGRRELVPVSLEKSEDGCTAVPLREGSGAITSLARADGYFVIPQSKETVSEGEIVEVKLFGGGELG